MEEGDHEKSDFQSVNLRWGLSRGDRVYGVCHLWYCRCGRDWMCIRSLSRVLANSPVPPVDLARSRKLIPNSNWAAITCRARSASYPVTRFGPSRVSTELRLVAAALQWQPLFERQARYLRTDAFPSKKGPLADSRRPETLARSNTDGLATPARGVARKGKKRGHSHF